MLVHPSTTIKLLKVAEPGESHEPFRIECEATSEPAPRYTYEIKIKIITSQ